MEFVNLFINVVIYAVSFLATVVGFGFILISFVINFVNYAVNLFPAFLKPFFLIILMIRLFKFITKRGNSMHRSSSFSSNNNSNYNAYIQANTDINKQIEKDLKGGKI